MIPQGFPSWVAVIVSDGLFFPRCGLWRLFRGGTGSWILALFSGSWLWRNITRRHWLVAYGTLLWLLALVEYSAEALACGFWCSSLDLSLRYGFFPLRGCARAEALALGFWPHLCLNVRRCGWKIRRYGRVGRTRQPHCQQNNTADGANGKPCPTALLLADKEKSGTI